MNSMNCAKQLRVKVGDKVRLRSINLRPAPDWTEGTVRRADDSSIVVRLDSALVSRHSKLIVGDVLLQINYKDEICADLHGEEYAIEISRSCVLVKVQRALMGTDAAEDLQNRVLIYNKDRSFIWEGAAPFLIEQLLGRLKAYFRMSKQDDSYYFADAPDQDW